MHRIHGGFTAAFPLKEEEGTEAGSLSTALKFLNNNTGANGPQFDQSPTTLFVSAVVLPAQYYNEYKKLPPTFVLATTYCGPLKTHLYELINTNRAFLLKVLMYCRGFNKGLLATDEEIYSFLKKHSHYSNFNSRCNYISKQDTQNEKKLRNEIETYIDRAQSQNAFKNCSAKAVKKLIQRHIRSLGQQYAWAHKPFKKNFREWLETIRLQLTRNVFRLLAFAIIAAPVLALIAAFFPALNLKLWLFASIPAATILTIMLSFQFSGAKTASRPPDKLVRQLAITQLNPVLNEMTATSPLKPGLLRPFFYASVIRILGSIAAIRLQIPTVSNIRWLVIDNKKRLLFFSCYSNTTDFYVRDFIVGNTANGVNFMFSNGLGFPNALLAYGGGILKDPEGYMHAVHTGQQVTEFWYAHEKDLSADVINKNRMIRNGLFKRMAEYEAKEWLRLL